MASSSPSTASSSSSMRLLTLLTAAASLVAAQVYVPGPVDDTPGAAIASVGAGVDGYTTYVIEGVTLQENAQSAIMTQYGTDGLPVVYNCALGLDAQATCSVLQGNGVAYNYVEPITFFGESTGQLPAAFQTTATPASAAATASGGAFGSSSSSSLPATSATSTPQAASANKAGPAAGQAQQTGANVFGAVDDTTGSASPSTSTIGKMVLGSIATVIVGGAMLFA